MFFSSVKGEEMDKTINATDAARKFSDLLNAVKYRGETFTVVRGGKPAAVIGPVETPQKGRKLSELAALLTRLPRLGDDRVVFARDLEEIIGTQPNQGEVPPWE
jgi:prevent-host-death family protein